jgi:hypothetical protein
MVIWGKFSATAPENPLLKDNVSDAVADYHQKSASTWAAAVRVSTHPA